MKRPAHPTLYLNAVISLNGKKFGVAVAGEFGRAPGRSGVALFELVAAKAKSALLTVVGTKQLFVLHAGKPLTLQASGGRKYTLLLEPRGSTAPMRVVGTH